MACRHLSHHTDTLIGELCAVSFLLDPRKKVSSEPCSTQAAMDAGLPSAVSSPNVMPKVACASGSLVQRLVQDRKELILKLDVVDTPATQRVSLSFLDAVNGAKPDQIPDSREHTTTDYSPDIVTEKSEPMGR